MKKITLAIAAIGLISMTSCKKDYTCTCTDNSGAKETFPIKDAKKKDAKDACDALSVLMMGDGSCSL